MKHLPRPYAALVAAAILGPALLLGAFAWWSWQRVQSDASAEITRTVEILAEQGLRLFRSEQLLLRSVDARVAGLAPEELARQQGALHAFLQDEVAQVPEVDAIFVIGRDGTILATSRDRLGLPTTASTDRAYFRNAAAGAPFVIDGPYMSRVTGERVLNVARRLSAPDGSFGGVALIVLRTSRLAEEWRAIVPPGDAVGLLADDGRFLARYPDLPVLPDVPRVGDPAVPRMLVGDAGTLRRPGAVGRWRRAAHRIPQAAALSGLHHLRRRRGEHHPAVVSGGGRLRTSRGRGVGRLAAGFPRRHPPRRERGRGARARRGSARPISARSSATRRRPCTRSAPTATSST